MSRKRIYNVVVMPDQIHASGQLFTDKELENEKFILSGYYWPNTVKAEVKTVHIYYNNYIRYAYAYTVLPKEYSTDEIEKILSGKIGKALDRENYELFAAELNSRKAPTKEFQVGDRVKWYGRDGIIIDVDNGTIVLELDGEEIYTEAENLLKHNQK